MTMQTRLRGLLGSKSKEMNSSSSSLEKDGDAVSEAPTLEYSIVSSIVVTDTDKDDEETSSLGSATDPYADVRDELERRSERDKARYATHVKSHRKHEELSIPTMTAYTVYLSYAVVIFWGHIRDFFARIFRRGRYVKPETGLPGDNANLFAPLLHSWEHFYTRRIYNLVQDGFNRPIASNPGAHIDVLERVSDNRMKSFSVLGPLEQLESVEDKRDFDAAPHYVPAHNGSAARRCINLGSYNYLGFADDWMNTCGKDVREANSQLPISCSSNRNEYGTTSLHRQLEKAVAEFLGKDDALCFNMGFNTNATTIPALVGRGDLLISDELNHTSIVNGARGSGAAIRVFRHQDMDHLEEILRQAIVMGCPRTRRPWNKIMVVVEGIYSMEGEYCDLRNVVSISKKYGAYVYLDEAHSIGAMGPTGRGVSEYCGVDTCNIDVMMGTFTKSFGGMGGYIAASKETIAHLRKQCPGSFCHNSQSPVVVQQCLSAFKIIMGQDGTTIGKRKIQALRDNSNYFRMRMEQMGLECLGQYDSPIIPMMIYNPMKTSAFSRECYKRGLAVVIVGFPAVPLLLPRARFCISAAHTREDIDKALDDLDEIADLIQIKYANPSSYD